ncbi:hypothetical protein D3C71_1898370 [compost metagenome]
MQIVNGPDDDQDGRDNEESSVPFKAASHGARVAEIRQLKPFPHRNGLSYFHMESDPQLGGLIKQDDEYHNDVEH